MDFKPSGAGEDGATAVGFGGAEGLRGDWKCWSGREGRGSGAVGCAGAPEERNATSSVTMSEPDVSVLNLLYTERRYSSHQCDSITAGGWTEDV